MQSSAGQQLISSTITGQHPPAGQVPLLAVNVYVPALVRVTELPLLATTTPAASFHTTPV